MINQANNKRIEIILKDVLGAFPELEHETISVVSRSVNRCMAAQPVFQSLFYKRINRKYEIIISRKKPFSDFIQSASDLVLRGWLAHELSHIVSYQKMSLAELIGFGVKYLCNKNFLRKIEIETDEETLRRGFKEELYLAADAVFTSPILPESYKKHLRENYLPPGHEIN